MRDLDSYKILEGPMMICIDFCELMDLGLSRGTDKEFVPWIITEHQLFLIVLFTQIKLL